MIDVQSWKPLQPVYADRTYHAHNRLIGSVNTTPDERRAIAREIARKLSRATGPVAFFLPVRGIHAWDPEGQPMHDPRGHAEYVEAFRHHLRAPVELHDLDLHINDDAFVDAALEVFDRWVSERRIPAGVTTSWVPEKNLCP